MAESSNTKSGGIGFLGLLTIVFIVLKLTGHIDWNWFWVLSPTLIPIGIVLLVALGFLIFLMFPKEEQGEVPEEIQDKVMSKDLLARFNQGKPQWHLMDMAAVEPIVRVLEYGAAKYAADNWKKPANREELIDSLMRHVVEIIDSALEITPENELDAETGLPHIAHVGCNVMFYLYHLQRGSWSEDRNNPYPKKEELEELAEKNRQYWQNRLNK